MKKFLKSAAAVAAIIFSLQAPTSADVRDASTEAEIGMALAQEGGAVFPVGQLNAVYAKYFTGRSFVYPMESRGVAVVNVTFEPGCINFWHRHHGSCQVLVGASGRGYYQIWGEEPRELLPGQSVTIPEGVKHWHGAQHFSWFQHIAIMEPGATTEWLEPVDPAEYAKLN